MSNNIQQLYPMLSTPVYKSKIWGGRKINTKFGKKLPANENIGESWEVADLKEGSSIIANGPLKNSTLTDIVKNYSEKIIGTAWNKNNQFPLLVKLIDSQDDLSVQVHPDAASCAKFFPHHNSKDETWIIIDAEENSGIFYGFNKGVSLEEYKNSLAANMVTDILRKISIKPGECVRLKPGAVHAILKGILMLEIQEPSDSTFRIYDYGRPGDDGKPRAIHLEEAAKVMSFEFEENPLLKFRKMITDKCQAQIIVDCPSYRIEKWVVENPLSLSPLPETARVIFNLESKVEVKNSISSFELKPGETMIVPAQTTPFEIIPSAKTTLITAGAHKINLMK